MPPNKPESTKSKGILSLDVRNEIKTEEPRPVSSNAVDYSAVIEDLRRRGLSSMADDLLNLSPVELPVLDRAATAAAQILEVVLNDGNNSSAAAEITSEVAKASSSAVASLPTTTAQKADLGGTPAATVKSGIPVDVQKEAASLANQVVASNEEGSLAVPVPVPPREKQCEPERSRPDTSMQSFPEPIPGPPTLRSSHRSTATSATPGAYMVLGVSDSLNEAASAPQEDARQIRTEPNLEEETDQEEETALEAVRVDDIMTVQAHPVKTTVAQQKSRICFGGCICFAVLVLVLVLSLSLNQDSINPPTDNTPTLSPTLAPLDRFDLLQEFLLDAFAPMYGGRVVIGSNATTGRLQLEEVFADPNSPQYRALEWIAFDDGEIETAIRLDFLKDNDNRTGASYATVNSSTAIDRERILQRYVLAVLFFSTGGPTDWVDRFEFLLEGHECDWSGALQCSDESIVYIDLDGNGLKGPLPMELGALSKLESIILTDNSLTSSLPPSLAALTALRELNVAQNSLSGELPEEGFINWLNLEVLKIGDNQISGTLSTLIGNLVHLKHFGAERMYWQGTVPRGAFSAMAFHAFHCVGSTLMRRCQLIVSNTPFRAVPNTYYIYCRVL